MRSVRSSEGAPVFYGPADEVTRKDVQQATDVLVALGVEAAKIKLTQGGRDNVLARECARAYFEAMVFGEVLLNSVQATDDAIVVVQVKSECNVLHN